MKTMKNLCMCIFLVVSGVFLVSFVIESLVSFIGLLLMQPLTALGYTAIAMVLGIGLFHFIDEVQS